jgi:hypothetical protein
MDQETLNLINKYREYNPEYNRYTDEEITQLGLPGFEQPTGINTIQNPFLYRNQFMTDLKNLPSDFKTSLGLTKNALVEDFGQLKGGLDSIKDKAIDLFGSGKELALKGIGSVIGGPIGSFIGGALGQLKETPEQKAIREFYEQNFGLTDTGQVASGIMQGYNPVYGLGGAGLQGAIDKRLATILKTEERKKKKGLKLSEELINRRKELEALKEKDRLAQLGANQGIGGFDPSGPTQRSIRESRQDLSGKGQSSGGFTNPGKGSYGPYS